MATTIGWVNPSNYYEYFAKGKSWNPIIGCNKISTGCKECYAEKMAFRLSSIKKTEYYKKVVFNHPLAVNYGKWNARIHFEKSQLEKPLKWKKPSMIFTVSMGDLFHDSVKFEWQMQIYSIMQKCPQHIFMLLTKRADNMATFFHRIKRMYNLDVLPNIWPGATIENQEMANKRIPPLLKIKSKIHWISVEPMTENIDISLWLYSGYLEPPQDDIINWVIAGGESGHNARPVHPNWIRNLRNQCEKANTSFFFKQWGEYQPITTTDGRQILPFADYDIKIKFGFKKVGKNKAGCLLDGKQYKQFPEL